jgi:hypothetical protein
MKKLAADAKRAMHGIATSTMPFGRVMPKR